MANDVILLKSLADELNFELSGGRVNKIYQPKSDELVFLVKQQKEKFLIMSANPTYPRIYTTNEKSNFPVSAPSFSMLLRKYLSTSRIEKVELFNCDRIIRITFSSTNELHDSKKYYLYFEGLGRYSNIVLADSDNIILDAIKRMSFGQSTRVLLPGIEYPIQDHTKIRLDNQVEVENILNSVASATEITDKLSGVSKATAKEIFASNNKTERLNQLLNPIKHGLFSPTIHSGSAGVTPTLYLTDKKISSYKTLNEALSNFYNQVSQNETIKENGKQEIKILKKLISKYEKQKKTCIETLSRQNENEKNMIYGNLILSYIYMIKKGDKVLHAFDYNTNQEVDIVLDPLKSPKDNAELYFRKYKKLKRSFEVATQMLDDSNYNLEYLENIKMSLNMINSAKELNEIRSELLSYDHTKTTSKQKKEKPSEIYCETFEGFKIYVGKNGIQNNKLTFEIAKGGDIWLHVKAAHGSHVVVVTDNKEVPYSVIYHAAVLALKYSQAESSKKAEVDYTMRKYVKRRGSAPGMVNYTNYKTIMVKLD